MKLILIRIDMVSIARTMTRMRSGIEREKYGRLPCVVFHVSPMRQLFITWHKSWSTWKCLSLSSSPCVCNVLNRSGKKFVTDWHRSTESKRMFGEARTWHMCHRHETDGTSYKTISFLWKLISFHYLFDLSKWNKKRFARVTQWNTTELSMQLHSMTQYEFEQASMNWNLTARQIYYREKWGRHEYSSTEFWNCCFCYSYRSNRIK